MKILSKDVPNGYEYCIVSDCPMASHCLRQMALQVVTKRDRQLTIINPKRTKPSEQCEYYRADEPQMFGKGFAKMQQEMLPRQYAAFMNRLQARFGRTGYFERRRGDRLCSPNDMTFIRQVLSDLGLSHLDFDDFVELYNWDN